MKVYSSLVLLACCISACVPAKKYKDLLSQNQKCNEELTHYKNSSLDFEGKSKELQEQYTLLTTEVKKLKADTNALGNTFRVLQTQYDKMAQQNESLEKAFDKLRLAGAKETANLTPKIGRARPLAERSLGHPDAGAISFAMMVQTINKTL
jgi:predicted nuclease with TOPRIM domain